LDDEVAGDGRVVDLDKVTRPVAEAGPAAVVVALGDLGVVEVVVVQDGRVGTVARLVDDRVAGVGQLLPVGAEEEAQPQDAVDDLGVIAAIGVLVDGDVPGKTMPDASA
jgi:hypothetical protein